MTFALGVRFIRLRSASVKGRASASALAARSICAGVIGLSIFFEVVVLFTLRRPPG